jgi:hypothetical protein
MDRPNGVPASPGPPGLVGSQFTSPVPNGTDRHKSHPLAHLKAGMKESHVTRQPPPQPPRSQFSGDDVEAYDAVMARLRTVGDTSVEIDAGDYFGALLSSPTFCAGLSRMGALVRTAADSGESYSHSDREFADQVLAAYWHTNIVMKLHIPDGLAAGVRYEAIRALRTGRDHALDDDERRLAAYIRHVVDGTLPEDEWGWMEQRLGRRGAVEYTAFIAFLQLTMRLYQAFGCPDPTDAEIDQLLTDLHNGTEALPNWRERIR